MPRPKHLAEIGGRKKEKGGMEFMPKARFDNNGIFLFSRTRVSLGKVHEFYVTHGEVD